MNNLTKQILVNRGFSNVMITSDSVDGAIVKEWHEKLDALHSCAYVIASCRYNGKDSGNATNRVFKLMGELYAMVGTLENGASLRSDVATANTIVSFATRIKTSRSDLVSYYMGVKRNASRALNALSKVNGANPKAIEKFKAEIASADAEIEKLKKEADNIYKEVGKTSAKAFYKAVEDYIADMISGRMILSEEEVQAEKKALNAARKARRKANK